MLDYIDPATLAYDEWLAVGMALKHEGAAFDTWDQWSQRDTARYKGGECERKWIGFVGNGVTWGTVVEFAKRGGCKPAVRREDKVFEWEDEIRDDRDDLRVIDAGWVEDRDVHEPDSWNPIQQLSDYISALFDSNEYVGYVNESWDNDGKWIPKNKGSYSRKAGELLHELSRTSDIRDVIGDYPAEAGAWIRFNPLDGKGVKDENVTAFRYALIESDTLTIERQAAIYAELELPIAALVHSGKKSLHAIVRIDAHDMHEYRDRVNFLHEVCTKNGLVIDKQNKNPSRLSRMPGVTRNGVKQFLVVINQGRPTFEAWRNWIEELNDNLPEIEQLAEVWSDLPPLAPPLIDGLLREGHKMLLAGPSKAGKSYILLQLAIAIAEGRTWLGWQCAQGRVLYVNLELDRPSCLYRLKTLYQTLGWSPDNLANIDIWNLRGKAVPMDLLAPKLIRRAQKSGYKAVIIDPIYKVITGDENAADKMAHLCNQFDRVCAELGAATIYCHHHSKGSQGQKNARDRSSGSGVFARDPDAILDLLELHIEPSRHKTLADREVCQALYYQLDDIPDWRDNLGQDDAIVAAKLEEYARTVCDVPRLEAAIERAKAAASNISGWRMEGTLREFPPLEPRRFFFRYPIHIEDTDGLLVDAKADGEEAPWERTKRDKQDRKVSTTKEKLTTAVSACTDGDEPIMIGDVAEYVGVDARTIKKWVDQTGEFVLVDNEIVTKAKAKAVELSKAIEACRDTLGAVKLADLADRLKQTDRNVRNRLKEAGIEYENGYIEAAP